MEKGKTKSSKGLIFILLAALFIGFFVYPKIIHPKGETAPEVPGDLSGEVGDGEVLLSWSAPSDGGSEITSYSIKVVTPSREESVVDTRSNEVSFSLSDLTNGETYTVAVAAVNAIGESKYSEPIEVTPESSKTGAPEAPRDLQGIAAISEISLSWTEPNEGGAKILDYFIGYKEANEEGEFTILDTYSTEASYTLSGLKSSTEYSIYVYAKNEIDNGPASDAINVTTLSEEEEEVAEFDFSTSPSVTTTTTTAQITWGTSKSASSQVFYGATDGLGYSTEKTNTSPRVTGHTVSLSNLATCTIYAYKVSSYDESENIIESTKGDFTTNGCKGDASVITYDKGQSTLGSGVTLNAKVSGRGISVVVPAAVVTGKDVAVQALKVSKEEIKTEVSKPTGKEWVGSSYILNAIEDLATEVTSLDKSVSVSIDYQNEDIEGIDPNTLKIWHYEDSAGWRELTSCSTYVNGAGGTVTCETDSFSVFGIFGEADSGESDYSGGSSSSSSGSQPSENTESAQTSPSVEVTQPTNNVVVNNQDNTEGGSNMPININTNVNLSEFKFTKDLWYQMKDVEVKILQRFLNLKGFTVSDSGAGAAGQETDYFGPKTKQALIKFQEAYRSNILTPIGLNFGTGFFGPQTRNFINSLEN